MKISEKFFALALPIILAICGFFVFWGINGIITICYRDPEIMLRWMGAGIGFVFGFIMQMPATEEEDEKMYQLTLEDVARYQEKEKHNGQLNGEHSGSTKEY